MCALFGWLDYKHIVPYKVLKKLTQALANAAEERGTDAAGISYIRDGKITIFKRPKPAHKIRFNAPDTTTAIMGHTRLTTQGNQKFNQNNHPFPGHADKEFAVFTDDELTNKKILKYFHGFECECKNKQLANDYLASRIHDIKSDTIYVNEYPGFSPYKDENNTEKANFICNAEIAVPEILKLFSPNIINRRLPKHQKNITEIKSTISTFLDTHEKCLLFTFNICGILSSLLNEIGYDMEQFLVISSTDYNDAKYASMYLKLYDRNKPSLSFDDSKPMIQKAFATSRDETIVISECTNIDNQSRRKDMLKLILSLDSQAQPHNTAIISTAAQHIPMSLT